MLFLVVVLVGWGSTAWLNQAALVPMSLALWTVSALLVAVRALRFILCARAVHGEHLLLQILRGKAVHSRTKRMEFLCSFLWSIAIRSLSRFLIPMSAAMMDNIPGVRPR
jgi:hypothetical protein